ncbi:MAG TPA: PEP/pyruvate-binding domain-containing protein [Chloroflexota bacterium]|jgi:pyruvate,water dikinase|nr:PEP/pyruvate-binding domain-containing protein [Chloroflexota bacterium]
MAAATSTDILWLDEPGCDECALVGGKAANLSRLAGLHPIPTGFALTTATFERAAASGLGGHGPTLQGALPDLYGALSAAYRELSRRAGADEVAVAVRSSAVDEDGAVASFAGQHETYLNVAGAEGVAAAVMNCWASAGSARALAYRRERGLALEGVRLAVLVQQLVAAEVAAVLFSANPVSGNRGEVVINASWGLGESIVGGTVTPDSYVVRKSDLAVTSRQVADKRRMTVPVPGGTREVEVPRFLRTRPALDDARAAEMARLALTVEAAVGWPVDVECAYGGEQLYLLQCRPITTLGSRRN